MANACKDLRPLIQDALDGELAEGGLRRLEAHAAECRSCAAELAAGRLAVAVLAELPAPEPGPGFSAAVARGIAMAEVRRGLARVRLAWAAVVGTCAISALLVAGWRVISPAVLAGAGAWAWDIARSAAPLAEALGEAALTIARGLVPLGGVAAKLSWLGLGWLAVWYALAPAVLLLVVVGTRTGRRVARCPILCA